MSVKEKGFTLIELMITLAVLAILLTVAAPGMFTFIADARSDAQMSAIVSSLQEARTYSLKERRSVTVCGGSVTSAAVPSCDGSWDNGWAVFVENSTTIGTFENADTVISVHDAIADNFDITKTNGSFISFDGRGWAASGNGDFKVCESSNSSEYARQVLVALSGRVSVQKTGVSCP